MLCTNLIYLNPLTHKKFSTKPSVRTIPGANDYLTLRPCDDFSSSTFTYLDDADADHEVGRSYPEARLPGWQWISGRWSGRDFIVALFFIGGRDDDRRFWGIGWIGSRVRRVRRIRRDCRQGWRIFQQRCLGVHLGTSLNKSRKSFG